MLYLPTLPYTMYIFIYIKHYNLDIKKIYLYEKNYIIWITKTLHNPAILDHILKIQK